MNDLKTRYNELLASYKRGMDLLAQNKDNKEKEQEILKGLEKVQLEMNDVLMKIGEYSEEETINGFTIEVEEEPIDVLPELIKEAEEKKAEKQVVVVEQKPEVINTMEDYQSNWKMAVQLSKSDLVPDTYKEKPENVIIALGIAQQTGIQPFTVMQNLNIVRGRASFSGSFCRTLIEKTGKYLALDIKYIGTPGKDDYGAYLEATRKDGSIVKGPEVTIAMSKAEGWYSKKDKFGKETSKWQTMPSLMLGYRATAFFARLYEPSALNGVYTSEEVEDISYDNKKEIKDVL